jgi:hypothetical protein
MTAPAECPLFSYVPTNLACARTCRDRWPLKLGARQIAGGRALPMPAAARLHFGGHNGDSTGLKHRICISCRLADVRGWSWFWFCRHSRAPRLARALSSGLRSEAPRSPVSTLAERLVGAGRKSLPAPGQIREKSSPDGLAGRRPSLPYSHRTEGSPNTVGIAIITMVHLRVSLPHDLGARILEIRKCRRWWL